MKQARWLSLVVLAATATLADLSGQVLDPAGKPVTGATVRLFAGCPYGQTAAAATDAAGRFRLTPPPQGERPEPWRADAWVDAPSYALSWRVSRREGEALEVRLEPPCNLDVPFVDRERQPLPGLRVHIAGIVLYHRQEYAEIPVLDSETDRLRAVTDDHGVARFSRLPRHTGFVLAVDDPAYATPRAPFRDGDRRSTGRELTTVAQRVVAWPAARLSGRVYDARTGRQMPGVTVHWAGSRWAYEQTDAGGRYEFSRLRGDSSGTLCLDLTEAQAVMGCAPARPEVEVAEGQARDGLDFAFSPGEPLTIQVVGPGGRPVAGAHVAIDGPQAPAEARCGISLRTGADGVVVARASPGPQRVSASITGHGGWTDDEAVTVRAGRPARIVCHVQPAPADPPIRVRVVGPDGMPVAGARVEQQGYDDPRAISGPDGRCEVVADWSCLVRASRPPLFSPRWVEAKPGQAVTLRLTPLPRGRIELTVRDERGRPLDEVSVVREDAGLGAGWDITEAFTEETGTAVLADVPAGRCRLTASTEGYGSVSTPWLPVVAGQTTTAAPLTLPRADQSIAGWVLDAAGRPVADAGIEVLDSDSEDEETTRHGGFRFDGLVAGLVRLKAVKAGRTGEVEAHTGRQDVGIRLK